MRLFVAVPIAPAIAADLREVIEALRMRVARQAPAARLTWVEPGRLHITLQFIGEVEQGQADAIRAALVNPLKHAPFGMVLAGTGVFPPRGAPRVLWVGVKQGAGELQAIAAAVARRLQTVGVAADARPFSPHLTLARVRVPAGLRAAPLFEGLGPVTSAVQPVDAITLVESRLSPRGPEYRPLQWTPLEEA